MMRIKRQERLKRQQDISQVFAAQTSVKAYPLRLVFRKMPMDGSRPALRIGFVASKRSFRHAHDRNHIKRRMREAVRCEKAVIEQFLADKQLMLDAMLIFTGRELPEYSTILYAWKKLRYRLLDSLASG